MWHFKRVTISRWNAASAFSEKGKKFIFRPKKSCIKRSLSIRSQDSRKDYFHSLSELLKRQFTWKERTFSRHPVLVCTFEPFLHRHKTSAKESRFTRNKITSWSPSQIFLGKRQQQYSTKEQAEPGRGLIPLPWKITIFIGLDFWGSKKKQGASRPDGRPHFYHHFFPGKNHFRASSYVLLHSSSG